MSRGWRSCFSAVPSHDDNNTVRSLARPFVCPIGSTGGDDGDLGNAVPSLPLSLSLAPVAVCSFHFLALLTSCWRGRLLRVIHLSPLLPSTCLPSHWETVHGFGCVLHILILQRLLSSSSSSSPLCHWQWQRRQRRRSRPHSLPPSSSVVIVRRPHLRIIFLPLSPFVDFFCKIKLL